MTNRYPLPELDREAIFKNPYFFLFETTKFDPVNRKSYIFTDPVDILTVDRFDKITEVFSKIELYAEDHYIAGYFSYELGYNFEDIYEYEHETSYPLLNLGVFRKAAEFDHQTGIWSDKPKTSSEPEVYSSQYTIGNIDYNISPDEYRDAVKKILEYISQGDIYQANYTFKGIFDFSGCPYSFYRDLARSQPVSFSSFLKFNDEYILSLSPELFFRRDGSTIESKPMKGTIKRGKHNQDDLELKQFLLNSEKDLAENTMIVDLIRNDIGRIAQFGSVSVPELHTIEKFRTLFQMTSTVRGRLKNNLDYFTIFKGLFPCGSVTGAPKIRAMQIIRELEKDNRNVYCGAIGIFFPGKNCVLNVPIRTITLNGSRGEIGLGSGIVADSEVDNEFDECRLKSHFLTKRSKPFLLLETLLWLNGYKFLEEHLRRIAESALYFDYPFNKQAAKEILEHKAISYLKGIRYRIRLTLSEHGELSVEDRQIKCDNTGVQKIAVSEQRTDPEDLFLYHKTTNRSLYDKEFNKYNPLGYCDVIFINNRDELTEGAISNIFLKIKGRLYTPPVSCGLLNGIYREYHLKQNDVEETILNREMLQTAEKIYVCNSVRGLIAVNLD